jgi:hypothetical protein
LLGGGVGPSWGGGGGGLGGRGSIHSFTLSDSLGVSLKLNNSR